MLRILFNDGGKACPVFDCDVCEDMIGVPAEGLAVWKEPAEREDLTKARCFHVHAGSSCEMHMRENFRGAIATQPLGAHVYYLTVNLEIGPDELKLYKARFARS